jgi:prolyl-tRNA synthetase
MLWSELSIQTLREDNHPLLVRAGYRRAGPASQAGWLPLGQRSLEKIQTVIRKEPDLGRALARCGVNCVAADGGFLVVPESGSDVLVRGNGYAALLERAVSLPQPPAVPDPQGDLTPEEFATPGVKTIAQVAEFTGIPATSQIKSLVLVANGELVLALLRGDHQMSGWKFTSVTGTSDVRQATADEIREKFGADIGSLGPVGLRGVRIIADEALRGRRNLISGANRNDFHLRNVTPGEDFACEFADLRCAMEGDRCAADGGPLEFVNATVIAESGSGESGERSQSPEVTRDIASRVLMAAAEQNYDSDGLALPVSIAPFTAVVVPVHPERLAAAQAIYRDLASAGVDALLDDRDVRPGVKFKDADLIGFPYRINVGKKFTEGLVELVTRNPKRMADVPVREAAERVINARV